MLKNKNKNIQARSKIHTRGSVPRRKLGKKLILTVS